MGFIPVHTQANTFAAIETALGPDVLLLEGLRGVERVSRLFHFDLELLSEHPPVDFGKIVGKPATIRIDLPDEEEPRYLHGHISQISQLRNRGGFAHYRAELVPWLWFLTRTTDCHIYQRQSVTEIIQQVCKDHGHSEVRVEVDDAVKAKKIEYCVQYRESDFNFISRLMEHYGISYYFEHKKNKHTLVLFSHAGNYPPCPGASGALPYKEDARAPGTVTDLLLRQDVRPAKVVMRDYNWQTPQMVLEVGSKGSLDVEHGEYEMFDYHIGHYPDRDQGEAMSKRRMHELQGTHRLTRGSSTFHGMASGHQFELAGHPRSDANAKYVALEVWHDLHTGGYAGGDPQYHNEFVALPVDAPLRPDRVTPRPVVEGPQTAVVVGEAGEEIYTDDHGRVKVQFHWDRLGKNNEDSSCWVRVSQGWAGKGFGAIFLPRIGQEVIVDFLEGDPDQPILTGAVYNANQTAPYDLPASRTRSTIKTNSYKGTGFNELRFEDKAGEEEVFIHAQKDFNEVVGHDHTTTVKNNQVITVTGHQTISVKGQGQSGTKVADKEVKGSALDVTGNAVVNASKSASITAPESITLKCGGSTITMVPGSITLKAGDGATLTLTDKAVMVGTLAHMDGTSTAQVTGPTTKISGDNITISGSATVKATGSGSSLSLDANADLAGAKASVAGKSSVSVSGGATAEIAAALVKIN